MEKLTLEGDSLAGLLDRLFPTTTTLNRVQDTIMSGIDDLKREVGETKAQATKAVTAIEAARTTMADLKKQLEDAANSGAGLTDDQAADLAAQLDASEKELAAAVAGPAAPPKDDGGGTTGGTVPIVPGAPTETAGSGSAR